MFLIFQCGSESSGRLVKERLSLTPTDFDSIGPEWGWRIFIPDDADDVGPEITHFEEEWTRRALSLSSFIDTVIQLFLEQTLPFKQLKPKDIKRIEVESQES